MEDRVSWMIRLWIKTSVLKNTKKKSNKKEIVKPFEKKH